MGLFEEYYVNSKENLQSVKAVVSAVHNNASSVEPNFGDKGDG